jgi:hypothetical protein
MNLFLKSPMNKPDEIIFELMNHYPSVFLMKDQTINPMNQNVQSIMNLSILNY